MSIHHSLEVHFPLKGDVYFVETAGRQQSSYLSTKHLVESSSLKVQLCEQQPLTQRCNISVQYSNLSSHYSVLPPCHYQKQHLRYLPAAKAVCHAGIVTISEKTGCSFPVPPVEWAGWQHDPCCRSLGEGHVNTWLPRVLLANTGVDQPQHKAIWGLMCREKWGICLIHPLWEVGFFPESHCTSPLWLLWGLLQLFCRVSACKSMH